MSTTGRECYLVDERGHRVAATVIALMWNHVQAFTFKDDVICHAVPSACLDSSR